MNRFKGCYNRDRRNNIIQTIKHPTRYNKIADKNILMYLLENANKNN